MRRASAAALGCCLRAPAWRLRPALAAMTAALLVACVHPTSVQAPPPAVPAPAPLLQPLVRQPGTPVDAPLSHVPQARYELAEGRAEDEDLPPGDEVPREEPAGQAFQRGGASWYGIQFHQRRTASGELFDMSSLTAAHKTLPFNSRVCVRSSVNGREVLVRVNDRGPFVPSRVIDVSRAAAEAIGMIDLGIKQVTLTLVGREGGRCAGVDVPALSEVAQRNVTLQGAASAQVRKATPTRKARPARRTSRSQRR